MIISKAPVRISLGGGGTDLKSYYEKYEGFVISAAINKFVYIVSNKRFDNSIRLSYSETEIVNNVNDIKHSLFKEALKYVNIENGIELVSMADVPANCGLGTSSSFLVSLLYNLFYYRDGYHTDNRTIAETACKIEIDILKESIGKQDQYVATYGGLKSYEFKKDGNVIINPIDISPKRLQKLEDNLLLVYLDKNRFASDILKTQNEKCLNNDENIIKNLHQIKNIGYKIKCILEDGDLKDIGWFFDMHWGLKKELSDKISDGDIDSIYRLGLDNGAIGGKVVGAGGGGFMLFYCDNKPSVIKSMRYANLKCMDFSFVINGVKRI